MKLILPDGLYVDMRNFRTVGGNAGAIYGRAELVLPGAIYPVMFGWSDCAVKFDNLRIEGVIVGIVNVEIDVNETIYDVSLSWKAQIP